MSKYKLQLKQIVDYPRCRIYRQFIRQLIEDRNIRLGGSSGLYYYTVLSCFANFRTSHKRIDGISYTVYPGEWVCRISEVCEWFRVRFHHQAFSILNDLVKRKLITFSLLGHGNIIKYTICDWKKANRVLEYNAPCQKDTGFFFLPISKANELVGSGRCSEMDVLLDMWINAVYNDSRVSASEAGPVVYFRNGTGCPLTCYAELAKRWGVSKATAGRYVRRLDDIGYITQISFPGTYGSAIYLQNYLSTMFQISDVMIDKEEVAMMLDIHISTPDENDQSVSKDDLSVSESHIEMIREKVEKILTAQGVLCVSCPKIKYKLFPLSDCGEDILSRVNIIPPIRRYILLLSCDGKNEIMRFCIKLTEEGS